MVEGLLCTTFCLGIVVNFLKLNISFLFYRFPLVTTFFAEGRSDCEADMFLETFDAVETPAILLNLFGGTCTELDFAGCNNELIFVGFVRILCIC
jgi:hypothetical protein